MPVPELIDLVHQSVQEITVVRNDQQGTVEGLESLFENVLGLDVHMVGGLVEAEQVVALEHQFGHSQARSLASAQHGNPLVYVFPTEKELGQQVPQLGTYVPHRNAVKGAEHRLGLVQDIFLILGEIAAIDIVAKLRLSGNRVEFPHDNSHHSGLTLAVAPHESHLLPSLDFDIGIAEYYLLRVSYGKIRALIDHIPRTGGRREFHREGGIVGLVDLYAVQLLQGLDPALYLVGLGGFVSEGPDELLGLLYHPLLILVGRRLLGYAFGPQLGILGIRDLVVVDAAQHQLYGTMCHRIQELPVVGYQHHGPVIIFQIGFQPFYGLYVQMVGRFVEQQQVRVLEEDLGKLYAHVPALAEGLRRPVELFGEESQAQKGPFRLHLGRFGMENGKTVVKFVKALYQGAVSR